MTRTSRWAAWGIAAAAVAAAALFALQRSGWYTGWVPEPIKEPIKRAIGRWSGIVPDRVLTYRDLAGHPLRLHLFQPSGGSNGALPAVVFFHGGGWEFAGPDQFFAQCRLLKRQGLVCVSVEYRVRSVHGTSPIESVQDARSAIRFLRGHAAELGIDPDRIAVGGGSAGGHLAAALGTALPLPDPDVDPAVPTRPDALVLLNPVLDLSPGTWDHRRVSDYWASISPLHHIDAHLPPTLILSGSDDPEVPVATVEAFCARARELGARCETLIYQGARHGFFNGDVEGGRWFRETTRALSDFLYENGFRAEGGDRGRSAGS